MKVVFLAVYNQLLFCVLRAISKAGLCIAAAILEIVLRPGLQPGGWRSLFSVHILEISACTHLRYQLGQLLHNTFSQATDAWLILKVGCLLTEWPPKMVFELQDGACACCLLLETENENGKWAHLKKQSRLVEGAALG